LELAVSDDGPGIPAEQLERVFERFHRVDEARSRDRGGTGLGLAIARAIVEAHGGRIWAEAPPGGGTTVRIELPGYR
jgi:signal transduction histidine kinase